MESEKTSLEPVESDPKTYEPPAVVASYSIDDLRRAAEMATTSIPG